MCSEGLWVILAGFVIDHKFLSPPPYIANQKLYNIINKFIS